MTVTIGRRDLLAALGGAAAWPLAARAQQGERMRRVAFLHPYAENDSEVLARVVAFRQGLEALGWTENRLVGDAQGDCPRRPTRDVFCSIPTPRLIIRFSCANWRRSGVSCR